jgi:hypothetical protein
MKRIAFAILSLLLISSTVGAAREWGIGISSEPLDIRGGGFFLDSYIDWDVLTVDELGYLSFRPSLGLGPLPLNARVIFLDLLGVFSMSLGNVGVYFGIGPGYMLSTNFNWSELDAVGIVGLDGISITDSITVYIQVKVRGSGFFISPGVGFVLGL